MPDNPDPLFDEGLGQVLSELRMSAREAARHMSAPMAPLQYVQWLMYLIEHLHRRCGEDPEMRTDLPLLRQYFLDIARTAVIAAEDIDYMQRGAHA